MFFKLCLVLDHVLFIYVSLAINFKYFACLSPSSGFFVPRNQMLWLLSLNICVGFINPGSLMDLLPGKSSPQQTTLRTTRNSWAGPKT